jgi:hypothetical protein
MNNNKKNAFKISVLFVASIFMLAMLPSEVKTAEGTCSTIRNCTTECVGEVAVQCNQICYNYYPACNGCPEHCEVQVCSDIGGGVTVPGGSFSNTAGVCKQDDVSCLKFPSIPKQDPSTPPPRDIAGGTPDEAPDGGYPISSQSNTDPATIGGSCDEGCSPSASGGGGITAACSHTDPANKTKQESARGPCSLFSDTPCGDSNQPKQDSNCPANTSCDSNQPKQDSNCPANTSCDSNQPKQDSNDGDKNSGGRDSSDSSDSLSMIQI